MARTISDKFRVVENFPSWAIPYMVNGDLDGLTEEDLSLIKEWCEKTGTGDVVDWFDFDGRISPDFSSRPAFGPACDVEAVVVSGGNAGVSLAEFNEEALEEAKNLVENLLVKEEDDLDWDEIQAKASDICDVLSVEDRNGEIPLLMAGQAKLLGNEHLAIELLKENGLQQLIDEGS